MSIGSQSLPGPHSASSCCAEVRVDDRVMRYRRSGNGPYVLVLDATIEEKNIRSSHLDALAGSYRVIVPELEGGSHRGENGSFGRWLTEFVEGLGLPHVVVVAIGADCMPAVELALASDAIARLVLLPGSSGSSGGHAVVEGWLESAVSSRTIPVRIVRGEVSPGELLAIVSGSQAFIA